MLRLLIIFTLASLNLISSAQSCIPDYINFHLQSQVDSFQINYPGCTEIEGDVYINGDNITNLNGLDVLTSIGGFLEIENTPSLVNFNGLNNISYIGMDLRIEDNDSLIDLAGLNGLMHINGSLVILKNPSLISLSGLNNLSSVGTSVNIGCSGYYWKGNPLLSDLAGLDSLSSIGSSLRVCWNHGLTDLSGIENLTIVENINISQNENLFDLNGLQAVTNVNGYITVSWNDSLSSLFGLNNLTTVGDLTLHRLPNLTERSGLNRLTTVNNNLTISHNFTIDSLVAFDSLTYIGGSLTLDQNYDLVDLSGLYNLTGIGADLEIKHNYDLPSLDGLSSVTSVGGDLIIQGNGDLTSLNSLDGITSINGNLKIIGNHLTSLSGIENIDPSTIENLYISSFYLTDCAFPNICDYLMDPNGVVDIHRNSYPCESPAQIAQECGFTITCLPFGNYHFYYQTEVDSFQINYPNCTDLGGSLYLHGGLGGQTGNYTNMDGLSVISSINGQLGLAGAYYLTSLSGLDNIDASSITDLYILSSPYLSECEVQSICDYLANPNGEVVISDNAYGCNSSDEILDACETVSVQENNFLTQFRLFPNPASDFLIIENQNNYRIDKVSIYNTIGQRVYSKNYTEPMIQVSELGPGIYILEIITSDLKTRLKFVIKN